jgi:hypothetical protein
MFCFMTSSQLENLEQLRHLVNIITEHLQLLDAAVQQFQKLLSARGRDLHIHRVPSRRSYTIGFILF